MAVRDVVRFVAEGSEDGSGRFEKVKEGAARSVMAAMEWRSAAMMSSLRPISASAAASLASSFSNRERSVRSWLEVSSGIAFTTSTCSAAAPLEFCPDDVFLPACLA